MVHATVMMKKTIQCTVVGDGMVGKTCLAKTFTGESLDEKYVATIFDNYAGKMSVSGDQYTISVFDCAGEVITLCLLYYFLLFQNIFIFRNLFIEYIN